ncbi:uncharacterized protein LOC115925000 [Strongylocentrotus purpuratus]|uniref:PKD/REJ-like domain-containing protein n=1 Tax=Strongylocentrotus purpuratus TaxID=7668 RepID=A0A7M7NZQ9_STRPU|nr:uncharacterized protein LOC115925000 [Strongylocentrotus purpuratus]
MIVGGRERDIGIGSGMVELDGSASRDPDQPGTDHLEFTWRCVQIPENILCVSEEDGSFFPAPEQLESASVSFNASHMAPNQTYEFTLRVATAYKESQETSVVVWATSGNAPQVLVSIPDSGPVVSTEPLALTAHVHHATPVAITWSIIGEVVAMEDMDFTGSASNTELEGSTWSIVHIEKGVLRPNEKYVVLVMATDEQGQTGSSQMELVMASGVSSCQLNLESGNTYTELDEITFTIDHCVTEEDAYPLTYQLLSSFSGSNKRSMTPAGVRPLINIVGPPAREGMGNRSFFAHVCNAHGSCSYFSLVASIEMRSSLDSEALEVVIVSQEALKGDYLKAFLGLIALSKVEERLAAVRRRRATVTSDRATEQLRLLYSAITTSVLDRPTASTLIDACPGIAIDDLSPEDIDNFLDKLHALVSVFGCDQEIPANSASVVLSIIEQIQAMTDDEDTMKMCRELTMSLTKANSAGLILGDSPVETSSDALTSTLFYDIPQGSFNTLSGEGAFQVDLGSDIAEMYGGYWKCGRGRCIGINIQFDQYSDNTDPYSTEDEDRDNRASAILNIALYDPSSCEELMVSSLSDPIRINMTVSAMKRNHKFKCHIWDEEDKEWTSDGIETKEIDNQMVECKVQRTGTCVILATERGGANKTVVIIVSIIGTLLILTLIIVIVIFILKKKQKDKGDGNVATNDRSTAVATAMTSDGKEMDGSKEASTEYAYDFNMQNMAQKVNC